jgi:class 3 adenylate cyclase
MRWKSVAPGTVGVVILTLAAPQLALLWLKVPVYTLTPASALALALTVTALISSGLAGSRLPAHIRARRTEQGTEEATVVFVDLRNSTPMVEKLGAKRTGKAQAHLLGRLSTIIRDHGGEVERTLDDGLFALFRHEGKIPHAQRAPAAVRAMIAEVEQIRPEWESAFGIAAGVTIGVESGEVSGPIVVTGPFEEWSSSGLSVNVAARRGRDIRSGRLCRRL